MKKTLQFTVLTALAAILCIGNLNAQIEKKRDHATKAGIHHEYSDIGLISYDRGDNSETFMSGRGDASPANPFFKGTVANPYMPPSGTIGRNVQCLEYIDGILYGVDYAGGNNFGSIDPATGVWTTIKSGFGSDGVSLCWNPVDGKVYVTPWTASDSANPTYGTVDLATGNFTLIKNLSDGNTFYMAIDNDGVAYAISLSENAFGTVNLATCDFYPIEFYDFNVNYISNLSIDRETNKLYWASRAEDFDWGGGDYYSLYFEINKANGYLTTILDEYATMGKLPQGFAILNAPIGTCLPPTDLAVTYTSDCKAELTWEAPADNANAKYNIYRDNSAIANNYEGKSFTDETLDPFQEHTWRVKAICAAGDESDEISVSKPSCKESCNPPTGLEVKYVDDCTTAELSWNAPAGEGLTYNVYRGEELLGNTEATTFTDTEFGDNNTWSVKTVCEEDESEAANVTKDCVGINERVVSFSIVPNPANNEITIKSEKNFNSIEVINFLGQTVISQVTNGIETTVDVSNLTGGVYFVRIASENGATVQKFVKK